MHIVAMPTVLDRFTGQLSNAPISFTDAGEYFGKVNDVVLGKFMIHGWVVKSTPSSMLRESLGNVRAVIVPHKAVRAIGDIVIISHNIELSRDDQFQDEPMPEGDQMVPMPGMPQKQVPPQQQAPFRF